MPAKKYIQLPHDYLSHSQMSLWLADPKRYAGLYFDKRDELRFSNSGQEYGRVVADALERGHQTGDIMTDASMLLLPKYDIADEAMHAEFKTLFGWLKLIGKPDTFNSETHEFREYKTGKVPWTQKKAQAHPQMVFYAIVIWLKYGTMLKSAHLDWIETESVLTDSGSIIRPTGRVQTFEVVFTPIMFFEMQAKMSKVARQIELEWASHVTDPELVNF